MVLDPNVRGSYFTLLSDFGGYRNREDISNLPPETLVKGSKNVLTNTADRLTPRKGYTLDGQASTATTGIESSFDWRMSNGQDRHMRSYDDELEFRFVASDRTITYNRLADGFTSVDFNYTEFWDTTELTTVMLFVNGDSNIKNGVVV